MHELSLMVSVLNIINEHAAIDHFSRVNRVCLEVGELCNVEIDALIFCFEIVMKGTQAEQASLDINAAPGKGWCQQCQKTVDMSSRIDLCPSCRTWDLNIIGGDRITVRELEVE